MNRKILFDSYRSISEAVNQKQAITTAAEWLLDNFHIVEEQLRDIKEHLPIWFYKELPKLADGLLGLNGGVPELSEEQLYSLDPKHLNESFLVQLIQRLRYQDPSVNTVLQWLNKKLVDMNTTADELVSTEHNKQSAANLTVRNIITSMRLISAFDWREFFESVSLVSDILSENPLLPTLDFTTQDYYFHAIEEFSKDSKYSEIEVAKMVIERTKEYRNASPGSEDRKGDPGYYLISSGKEIYGVSPGWLLAFAIVGFIPASDIVIAFLNKLVMIFVGPRHLPRIKFKEGVPESMTSFVVMPILLINEKIIEDHIEQLEVHYLSSPDGYVHFGLLSDWKDSSQEINLADGDLLEIAIKGIEQLNIRYGTLSNGQKLFFSFIGNAGGIRESLDHAIDARSDLDDDVHFFVKDGVVTLTGTVDTAQEQKDAETVANSIQGVTHVVNKLVSENAGLKAEYPNNTTIQQNSTYTETTKSRTTL